MNANDRKSTPTGEMPRWLDEPRNVRKLLIALAVACVVLFLADAVYHKHPYFSAESWFGFYAFFGFVMCIAAVLAAKAARFFLMRDEDYYDRDR